MTRHVLEDVYKTLVGYHSESDIGLHNQHYFEVLVYSI